MKSKDKLQDALFKVYIKKLAALYKQNFDTASIDIKLFVTYLQYLRDYHIIKSLEVKPDADDDKLAKKIIFFTGAVAEYEQYENCIHNYYDVTATSVLPKNNGGREETLAAYNKEKNTHLNTFWEIIKLNIEDWRENGITI